jgi:hypothetical protein
MNLRKNRLGERIAAMRRIKVFFIMAFAVAWASYAHAALVFNTGFAQDGTYDSSWPMRAGEVVAVDIYVSSVPTPGLISMGFKLTYDSSKLEVVTSGTTVDTTNWPIGSLRELIDVTGDVEEIHMAGFRVLAGLAGDNIRLGTVTFRCKSEGTSEFKLLTRGDDYKGFVLDCVGEGCDPLDPVLCLDGDIGAGVLLATIRPPILGDVNGDGVVNLADGILILKVMAQMGQGEVVHTTGDVNGDGVIGVQEVIYILQRFSELR